MTSIIEQPLINNLTELLKTFDYGDKKIRVFDTLEETWFCGNDVASILEYKCPQKAISKHVEMDDKTTLKTIYVDPTNHTAENKPCLNDLNSIYINESGVYSLALRSKMKAAKEFRKWITKIVLPSIRKNGAYVSPNASPEQLEKLKSELAEKDKLLLEKDKVIESKQQAIVDKDSELNRMHMTQQELVKYKKKLERNEIVYIISTVQYAKQGIYKIGKTNGNMKARLSTHNTSHVSTDKVVILREFKVNDSLLVEKNIHNKLEGLLVDGEREFFMCPFDLLESVVDMIVNNDGEENIFVSKIIDIVYQLKNKIYDPAEWMKGIPEGTFPTENNITIQNGTAEPINLDVSQWSIEQKQQFLSKCITAHKETQAQIDAIVIIWKDFQQLIISHLSDIGVPKKSYRAKEWHEAMDNEAKNEGVVVKWVKGKK